eukprot:217964-Chlamydomonas_euryale.AAC.7
MSVVGACLCLVHTTHTPTLSTPRPQCGVAPGGRAAGCQRGGRCGGQAASQEADGRAGARVRRDAVQLGHRRGRAVAAVCVQEV